MGVDLLEAPVAPTRPPARELTVVPGKKPMIVSVALVKESDRSAPIVLAATVEGFE
jgi:hypothetical protein